MYVEDIDELEELEELREEAERTLRFDPRDEQAQWDLEDIVNRIAELTGEADVDP
ncbi:hypothetical protein PBI_LARENN_73 [Mycobacterium phage Larenn]|uniref:Uncharacterized protein n=1 Tax=Mycobacterium phage Larenn TaxID=1560285 RepID=A0A0A0RM90_9CAUD|nr:hypothetical protein PBI_LARENN_73 [Mycobacterium phage Larenn]AIW02968.1 hypothetical protein PBI_LARENN_73 [Mycobacterium phage Larenn]